MPPRSARARLHTPPHPPPLHTQHKTTQHNKTTQLPLWDELWWDDGLKHSQPVLDFTVGDAHGAPARNALQLFTALGVMVGGIFACKAAWSDDKMLAVPPQYPPEVLEAYTKRGKVLAREPKLA